MAKKKIQGILNTICEIVTGFRFVTSGAERHFPEMVVAYSCSATILEERHEKTGELGFHDASSGIVG